MQHIIQEWKEELVRDICSVSVAPASKSEVRRIISERMVSLLILLEEQVGEDEEFRNKLTHGELMVLNGEKLRTRTLLAEAKQQLG